MLFSKFSFFPTGEYEGRLWAGAPLHLLHSLLCQAPHFPGCNHLNPKFLPPAGCCHAPPHSTCDFAPANHNGHHNWFGEGLAVHPSQRSSSQDLFSGYQGAALSCSLCELGVDGTLTSELDLLNISIPEKLFFFSSRNTAPYCVMLHLPGEQIP